MEPISFAETFFAEEGFNERPKPIGVWGFKVLFLGQTMHSFDNVKKRKLCALWMLKCDKHVFRLCSENFNFLLFQMSAVIAVFKYVHFYLRVLHLGNHCVKEPEDVMLTSKKAITCLCRSLIPLDSFCLT